MGFFRRRDLGVDASPAESAIEVPPLGMPREKVDRH
jgi:hypothetical protein